VECLLVDHCINTEDDFGFVSEDLELEFVRIVFDFVEGNFVPKESQRCGANLWFFFV